MKTYLPFLVIFCAITFPFSAPLESLKGDDGVLIAQMSNQMIPSQDTRSFQDNRAQDNRQSASRAPASGTEGTNRPESRFSSGQSLGHASDQQDARMQDSSRQSAGPARR